LRPPPGATAEHAERVLVRDVRSAGEPGQAITLSPRPDDAWLRSYRREIPIAVLTAVVDGELMFGAHSGGAIARAAVTDAPDGTRWVGLSAIRADDGQAGAALCEAMLAWGAERGATRGYTHTPDTGATDLVAALGFRLHHRRRYVRADTV
jgi:hypothetical protein